MSASLRFLLGSVAVSLAPVLAVPAQPPARAAAPTPVARESKPLKVDAVAAIVGDKIILESEVLAELDQARANMTTQPDSAALAKLHDEILQGLVDSELLVQKATAEKIEVKEADLQREVDERQKQIRARFNSDAELRTALQGAGFGSVEEWRKLQIEMLKRRNMQQELFQKLRRDGKITNVNVTEAEVTEAYETQKARMPRKEATIGFRQIVLATKPSEPAKKRARAKADSILVELKAHPETFETAAKRESMDPGTKELGGDLGWNRRGKMVPEFDRVMFALNPGVLSPVVESPFGYHIIRVDKVQPAEVKARHILIRSTMDSADADRARKQADSVVTAWRAGGKYDTLSAHYHDFANDEQPSVPEFLRAELPESYRNAIEGKKVGDIIDPFPIIDPGTSMPKFVILQLTLVEEAGEYTLSELRAKLRAQLAEEGGTRRYLDTLRKQTYVSVRSGAKASTAPKIQP